MFNKIKAFVKQYLIIVISIILIIFFWLAEYTLHYFIVSRDTSLSKWFVKDPMEFHMLILMTLVLMAFGLFIHILTLRKENAENEANKNQIRYQSLFSSMLNGFALHRIIVDESGRPIDYEFLEVNDAFERMTGLFRKDIIGCQVTKVMPELIKDTFDWVGAYGRVALNNEKLQVEQYSTTLGKWYNINAHSPSTGEFATVIEDISERKKIESLIMESQERMEVIFNAIQAGIVVVDRETHNITYVNQTAAKMIGATQDSIMDRPCHKFICPAEIGACPITDQGQKIDNSERILLTVDGRQIPIIKTVIETELIGRRVLVESFVDISELKQAEQQVILQSSITENITDAITVSAANFAITYVNKAAEKLYGYHLDELKGKMPDIFNADPLAAEIQQELYQTVSSGKTYYGESLNRKKDGSTFYCEYKVMPLKNPDGTISAYIGIQRDITERKRAEEKLRESEEKYRNLIENQREGIGIVNEEEKFVFANSAADNIFGLEKGLLVGRSLKEYLTPAGIQQIEEESRQRKDGKRGLYELEINTETGEKKIISVSAIPQTDSMGKRIGTMGLFQDITERKQAEEELRASEEKFRLITENTADTITVMDLDLKITYVSPSIQKLRGYTAEEAKTQSIDQIILPAYLPIVYKIFEEQMALEERGADPSRNVLMEVEESCKDGTVIWAEVTMSFLRDKNNKAAGIATMTKDITERKRAEEKLKESETQKRLILQSMPVAVYTSKIDQETDATWISGNVDELAGFSAEEFLSKPDFWRKRLHPDDRDRVLAAFKDAAVSGLGEIEYRWRHRDGHYKWFQDRFIINQADGQPEFLGVMSDVTQRKLYEKEIEKATSEIKLLLDSVGEGIYGLDDQGKTIFINQAGAQLLGYQPEEMLGMVQHELTHHTKPDGSLYKMSDCPIHAGFKDGNVHNVTGEVFWRKDGSNFPVEYISTPIKEEGKINGSVVVFRDVTERKQTEALQAAIYKISEISSSADNLLELYAGIHMIIDEMMSTVNFYIAMNNEKEGMLEFPYFVDERDPSPDARPLKKGLTEYVLRTGKALLAPPMMQKMLAQKGEVEIVGTPSIDWMGVPLNMGKTTLGVLVVQSYREEVRFGAKQLSILNFISDNIAAAILRKKSEEEREKSEKLQGALYHISEAAAQSDNLEALYGEIHKVVAELTSTKNFYLAIYNEKEQLLSFPYTVDEFDPRPQSRKLGHGLTEYVLNTGIPLLADRKMQQLLAEQGKTSVVGTPAVEWAGVPLKEGGRIMGVLVIQSYREDVRFGTEALSMLNFVSDNIALAISRKNDEEERKKLIKELQASLDNIKTLKGLVPICSSCKKIRNDKGYWQQVEVYVAEHTEADFSHGICDECAHKLYPQYFKDKKNKSEGEELG